MLKNAHAWCATAHVTTINAVPKVPTTSQQPIDSSWIKVITQGT